MEAGCHAGADAPGGDVSPSQETVEKAKLSKLLIESHYTNMQKDRKERLMRRKTLEQQMEQLQCSSEERTDAIKEFGAKESLFLRIRRQRMGIDDFETIKVIGRGAFGEVRLCRSKDDTEPDSEIYAIKVLRKKEMRQKDQIAHVRAERDLMRQVSRCLRTTPRAAIARKWLACCPAATCCCYAAVRLYVALLCNHAPNTSSHGARV